MKLQQKKESVPAVSVILSMNSSAALKTMIISIRELAVQIKKEGITFPQLALMYRRHNYIKKLGANEEQIESLIANLLDGARSLPEEKIVDLMNQVYEISKSESIPLT